MNFSNAFGTRRVLIIDDEPSLRDLFAVALTNEQTEVVACTDGFTALRALENGGFDAVLLDLSLPDINGIHILREMRRRGDRTAVILCSAHVDERSFMEALELDAAAFISKPVTLHSLRRIVSDVIAGTLGELGSASAFAEQFGFSCFSDMSGEEVPKKREG
ncbi:MAG: response regulator [Luteolibacter sp.]